ncbi:hypothetical protein PROFUN_06382 [Planoprotostelium fungivorum]|uniref:Uncharacterized protein n=1 Tax=Planoprotostelium fungivorum TaxID=1890364 RepID=A0A2P6NNQ8_9EUKA|nr:hypothetical protein PROFUN_06382 [Planoprotostelium fungivorum]
MNPQMEKEMAEKEAVRLQRSMLRIAEGKTPMSARKVKAPDTVTIVTDPASHESSSSNNNSSSRTGTVPAWKIKMEEDKKIREQREQEMRDAKERVMRESLRGKYRSAATSLAPSTQGSRIPSPVVSRAVSADELPHVMDLPPPPSPSAAASTNNEPKSWAARDEMNWTMPEISPKKEAGNVPAAAVTVVPPVVQPAVATVQPVQPADATAVVPPVPVVQPVQPVIMTTTPVQPVTVATTPVQPVTVATTPVQPMNIVELKKAEKEPSTTSQKEVSPTKKPVNLSVTEDIIRHSTTTPPKPRTDEISSEIHRPAQHAEPDDELLEISRVESIVRHTNDLRGRKVVDPMMDDLIATAVHHCRGVLGTLNVGKASNFSRIQFEEISRNMVRAIVNKLTQVPMEDEQRKRIVVELKSFTTVGYSFLQTYYSHMNQELFDAGVAQVRAQLRQLLTHFKRLRSEMDSQPRAVLQRNLHKVSCMASDMVTELQKEGQTKKEENSSMVQEYIGFMRSSIVPLMAKDDQARMVGILKDLLKAGIEMNRAEEDAGKRMDVIDHLLTSLRSVTVI